MGNRSSRPVAPRPSSQLQIEYRPHGREMRDVHLITARINKTWFLDFSTTTKVKHWAVVITDSSGRWVYDLTEVEGSKKMHDVVPRRYEDWRASRRHGDRSKDIEDDQRIGKTDWTHDEMKELAQEIWQEEMHESYSFRTRNCQYFAWRFIEEITDGSDPDHGSSYLTRDLSRALPEAYNETRLMRKFRRLNVQKRVKERTGRIQEGASLKLSFIKRLTVAGGMGVLSTVTSVTTDRLRGRFNVLNRLEQEGRSGMRRLLRT